MDYTSLETLDHAKALVELVYSTYGLTFHREYVYFPDQLLELNRREHVRSFIALEGRKVVGHLAWIRPFFELQRGGEPISDPGTGEVGLSIVRPECRSQHVQTHLGVAMNEWARARGSLGAFMKCVTNHIYSQRAAAGLGCRPLALFLAGVPKWVVYDNASGEQRDPISTLLFHAVLRQSARRPLCLPEGAEWVATLARGTGADRVISRGGDLEDGETDLVFSFEPAKHLAQLHVLTVGADLVARIAERRQWLMGGHMKHVSYFLPADSPRVQASAGELAALGLFLAGWVPCLHAGERDVLIYQSTAYERLDLDAIHTFSDDGAAIKQAVTSAWASTRPG